MMCRTHTHMHKASPVNVLDFIGAITSYFLSGFGGLGVACWPLVPKFMGSNPAKAVGFFRAKKSSACHPSARK
jgi:hypothetical protein